MYLFGLLNREPDITIVLPMLSRFNFLIVVNKHKSSLLLRFC